MLGSDIAAELFSIQAQAESLMVDTCLVRRVISVVTDPLTGIDTGTYASVYTGKCRVQFRQGVASVQESADSSATVQHYELHVPVTAGPFEIGDVVTVNGVTFRITSLHVQTFRTAQRLPMEQVS